VNAIEKISEQDRDLFRQSMRGFLADNWPAEKALVLSGDDVAIRKTWSGLCGLGAGSLGVLDDAVGLYEALMLMEEFGRAAAPFPLIDLLIANTVLSGHAPVEPLLGSLQAGAVMPAFAAGAYDGDPNAGALACNGETVSGNLAFVELLPDTKYLLALVEDGPRLALIELVQAGVQIAATPGFAFPAYTRIMLDSAKAQLISLPAQAAQDLNLIFRIGMAARAMGAASRAFELVLGYLQVRQQFGQPLGRFQALQHKLANSKIALDGARLTLFNAANFYDQKSDDWRVFASAAIAASASLRQVALETQHTFGAIGYSEEHEAPRHFRRVHADLTRSGGVRRAREELATYLLGSI